MCTNYTSRGGVRWHDVANTVDISHRSSCKSKESDCKSSRKYGVLGKLLSRGAAFSGSIVLFRLAGEIRKHEQE
jgi:hypothetical protein